MCKVVFHTLMPNLERFLLSRYVGLESLKKKKNVCSDNLSEIYLDFQVKEYSANLCSTWTDFNGIFTGR